MDGISLRFSCIAICSKPDAVSSLLAQFVKYQRSEAPCNAVSVYFNAIPEYAEMELQQDDTWGHFAPMFHLVDAFAIYAITLVGGRHAVLPAYNAQQALLSIGKPYEPITCPQGSGSMLQEPLR